MVAKPLTGAPSFMLITIMAMTHRWMWNGCAQDVISKKIRVRPGKDRDELSSQRPKSQRFGQDTGRAENGGDQKVQRGRWHANMESATALWDASFAVKSGSTPHSKPRTSSPPAPRYRMPQPLRLPLPNTPLARHRDEPITGVGVKPFDRLNLPGH